MTHDTPYVATAAEDFRRARRRAAMQELTARLTGRTTELLSFEEVRQKLRLGESSERGRQEIPLEAIVGSVGRYSDFTRSFLPRQDSDQARWVGVKEAMSKPKSLPPIEVYQIDQVYFVLDGNHRVSVARQLGMTHIEAHVIECKTPVPLGPDDRPDDLIVKAEYANFLEQTRFTRIRPEADLQLTAPGQYEHLFTHIEAHHFLLSQDQQDEVSYEASVGDWYDTVYLPLAQDIQERGLLRDFPGRTETDLYLWIFEHRSHLDKKLGWHIELEAATADLGVEHSHTPKRVVARVEEKLIRTLTPDPFETGPATGEWRRERFSGRHDDRLFASVLVPVSGDEGGWHALEMALEIALRETGQLFGLHVVSSAAQKKGEAALAIQREFQQRCHAAGIPGELTIESGNVLSQICDRARWTDLIIMYPANPPGPNMLSRLSSGSRNIIHRSCRPILMVPHASPPPQRILLAYDGSPNAREGLFVATYFATHWQVSLTVLTVIIKEGYSEMLVQAQQYLEKRGVTATFKSEYGKVADDILKTAEKDEIDLIITGGYDINPLHEVMLGNEIDQILRESRVPVLICR